MSNIKKAMNFDLKNKEVNEIVALVDSVYKKNGLNTELELQFIQLKINADPNLVRAAKANPESLYNSILQAAESGLSLNPQWQEAYLVPYNMKIDGKDVPTITMSPMYRGKKKLLIVKGIVKGIETKLVYEGEYFEENIVNGVHQISHKPNSFNRKDQNKIIGGYAIVTLNNDEKQYIVKGRDYFDRCMKASQNKMGGKTSPAWMQWFDQMCEKCLVNAADSVIPKIGIDAETTELLNDINTNDIDFVDVTNENMPKIDAKKEKIPDAEFDLLIKGLKEYEIPLSEARKNPKKYFLSNSQKDEILKAGTIDDKRLDEIVHFVVNAKFELNHFEFFLDAEQFETVKNAVIDYEISNQK
jgi:recombinational DNA repair protein RecT